MTLEKLLSDLDKVKTDWEAWRILHTIHLIVQNNEALKEGLPINIKEILYGGSK